MTKLSRRLPVAILAAAAGTVALATGTAHAASAPTIAKSFGASSIPLNDSTTLTLTMTNPDPVDGLTGVSVTDTFPSGLVVSNPAGLNTSCNGTTTAVAGSSSVSHAGASLGPSSSCVLSVDVKGTTIGNKPNTTGAITSAEFPSGTNTASDVVTVVAPPTISKSFGAASVQVNDSTTLSFTLSNPNAVSILHDVEFTDPLPAGMVVSTPNGLTATCGGTKVATAGSGSVSLLGATLGTSSSCSIVVDVTGLTEGLKNNVTGQINSTEGGPGGTASASIAVAAPGQPPAGQTPVLPAPVPPLLTATGQRAAALLKCKKKKSKVARKKCKKKANLLPA